MLKQVPDGGRVLFAFSLCWIAGAMGACSSSINGGANSVSLATYDVSFVSQPGTSATAGHSLSSQPIVQVLDSLGAPVSGVVVTLYPSTGGACATVLSSSTLRLNTAVTSEQGLAAFTGLNSTQSGAVRILASVEGSLSTACSSAVTQVIADAPYQILSSTSNLTGAVSQLLNVNPKFQVVDAFGNPVSGVTLNFTSSAGSLSVSNLVTDAGGYASVPMTLGASPGTQTVSATAASPGGFSSGGSTLAVQSVIARSLGSPSSASLSVISPGQASFCSVGLKLNLLDSLGYPAQALTAMSFGLSGGTGGVFYSSADCSGSSISTVSVAQGATSATFYATGMGQGTVSVVATSGGISASSDFSGWSTKDEFNYNGSTTVFGLAVATDKNNQVYVSGYANESSNLQHGIMRKSSGWGQSFATILDYQLDPLKNSSIDQTNSLDISADGTILIGAISDDSTTQGTVDASILRSTDGGANFSTLMTGQYSSGYSSDYFAIKSDALGNTYAALIGGAADGEHLLIKKSTNGGLTWTTVHTEIIVPDSGSLNQAAFGINPIDQTVYFATNKKDLGGYDRAYILKSSDSGTSWTVSMDWSYTANQDTLATAVHVDQNGYVYAVCNGVDSGGSGHWIIRRNLYAGDSNSWVTVEDFVYNSDSQYNLPFSITEGSDGSLYVAGTSFDQTTLIFHWIVRKSLPDGSAWYTSDDFVDGSTGSYAGGVAYSIAADSLGHLYTTGVETDVLGNTQLAIRGL